MGLRKVYSNGFLSCFPFIPLPPVSIDQTNGFEQCGLEWPLVLLPSICRWVLVLLVASRDLLLLSVPSRCMHPAVASHYGRWAP